MQDAASFSVREATVDDAGTIARQRATMWRDMGRVDDAGAVTMAEATRRHLERLVPGGSYRGWLACAADDPERVVGGVGVHLRQALPRPLPDGRVAVENVQALVVNVYTDREWRRRGVAEALMRALLAWCEREGITNVILHASDEGRGLYEKLGFVPTNEMRYAPGAGTP